MCEMADRRTWDSWPPSASPVVARPCGPQPLASLQSPTSRQPHPPENPGMRRAGRNEPGRLRQRESRASAHLLARGHQVLRRLDDACGHAGFGRLEVGPRVVDLLVADLAVA